MSGVEITDSGLGRFAASVHDAADQVTDLDATLDQAAADVLGIVTPPIRTGALARTVDAVVDALGFTLTAGGPSAPYGPRVHAYNPFLSRAIEQRTDAIVNDVADHLNTTIATIKD